jgi:hypothetical protein
MEVEMTHQAAINLAHDLQRPFMWLQYNAYGRIMSVKPYYVEKI